MNSAAFTKLLKRDASLKSSPGPNSIIVHAVLCSIQVSRHESSFFVSFPLWLTRLVFDELAGNPANCTVFSWS